MSFNSSYIERDQLSIKIMRLIMLIFTSMLFGTMMMAYFIFRNNYQVWPPPGFAELKWYAFLPSSLALLLSSITLWVRDRYYANAGHSLFKLLTLGTLLWASFYGYFQVHFWKVLITSGLEVKAGIWPSIIHGYTWIHAAHVLLGMIFFAIQFFYPAKFFSGGYIQLISAFWHLLLYIWLFLVFSFFV
jgi:cytochrome c oxidase subunit 3